MTKQVIHSLVNKDGARIEMPAWCQGEDGWGNLAHPNVYLADSSAKYPVGTKFVEGERVFYYGKHLGRAATEGATPASTGADEQGRFHFTLAYQADMASSLCVRKIADETSMWYQTTISAQRSTDYLSGGWVNGKDTGTGVRPFVRRIVAHNYSAAHTVGGTAYTYVSELQLDQAIVTSATALTSMLLPNPWKFCYREVQTASAIYYSVMGACMNNNPGANYYVWYQTWGPCSTIWMTDFGGASNRETVYSVYGDGSIISNIYDGSTYYQNNPIAGQIMYNTYYEGTVGADEQVACMIYLQIRK